MHDVHEANTMARRDGETGIGHWQTIHNSLSTYFTICPSHINGTHSSPTMMRPVHVCSTRLWYIMELYRSCVAAGWEFAIELQWPENFSTSFNETHWKCSVCDGVWVCLSDCVRHVSVCAPFVKCKGHNDFDYIIPVLCSRWPSLWPER